MSVAQKGEEMRKKNAITGAPARLLRRVAKHILAEPKRFAMSWWHATGESGKPLTNGMFDEENIPQLIVPECGTVACIAGWAVVLNDGNGNYSAEEIHKRAKELLGDQADDKLFGTCNWPNGLGRRYDHSKTRKGKATVAAARINHYIKTG